MDKRFVDLTGKRFGRYTVLELAGKKKGSFCWKCKCDCGTEKIVRGQDLKSGSTKSCGCWSLEVKTKRFTKHGLFNTQLFGVWSGIKDRTNQDGLACKGNYRKNNISICEEWKNDFKAFYDWAMANGYKYEKLPCGKNKWTIDRIDNNKGYSPDNCRWVDRKVQANNRGNNVYLTYNEKTQTLAEWAEETHISAESISRRLANGYSIQETLFKPPKTEKRYEYKGEFLTAKQIAQRTDIPLFCIKNRIANKWDIEKIMTTPLKTSKRTKIEHYNENTKPNISASDLYEYNGETLTVSEIAKRSGVKIGTLKYRLWRGWGIEKATQK